MGQLGELQGAARTLLAIAVAGATSAACEGPLGDPRDADRGLASQEELSFADNVSDSTGSGSTGLPGTNVFGDRSTLDIALTLPEQDLRWLDEQGNDEQYVSAQATISGTHLDEVSFVEVGLRHKGAYSLHHCWDDNGGVRSYERECARLSYKLKFNEFDQESRLDGLKKLNVHSSSGDGSRLRELLAYDTYRGFGVDAPRTTLIRLTINGRLSGVYIGVEAIDGRYTKAHYPSGGGDGDLYKEIWPSPALDAEDLLNSLRTNQDEANGSRFAAFADAFGRLTGAELNARASDFIHVDSLLRYMAVDRALRNWDGITAFYSPRTPHNFYWYDDAAGDGKFHLIPWDMDNTLWEFDPYMYPEQWVTADPIPDWNELPNSCEPRSVWQQNGDTRLTPPRCDPFLDWLAQTGWNSFDAIGRQLLSTEFEPQRFGERIDFFAEQLEPLIDEDPLLDRWQWRQERDRLKEIATDAANDFEGLLERGLTRE